MPGDVRRGREAADLHRSVRVAAELRFEVGDVDTAGGVLADGDDLRAGLPPRQLVRVVLVGADEDDRPLGARPGEVEEADQLVDGARRARAAEHDDVLGGAVHRRVDDPACLLAQRRGLPPRRRGLRVRVRVQRQDAVADEVLDERQRAPGRRVVRVHQAARPERPVEHLVVADHRAADAVDQRLASARPGRVRMATDPSAARTCRSTERRADQERGRAVVGEVREEAPPEAVRGRARRGARRGAAVRRGPPASRVPVGPAVPRLGRPSTRQAPEWRVPRGAVRMPSSPPLSAGCGASMPATLWRLARASLRGASVGFPEAAARRRLSVASPRAYARRRRARARERDMQTPTVAGRRLAERDRGTPLLEREAELDQLGGALRAAAARRGRDRGGRRSAGDRQEHA